MLADAHIGTASQEWWDAFLVPRRGQRLPEEQVLRWITQALLALKYIHAARTTDNSNESQNEMMCQTSV